MSATPDEGPVLPCVATGGCHCGAVRFRVTVRNLDAVDCNCSICTKKGFLHLLVPEADFEWVGEQGAVTVYRFNTGVAAHMFCKTCGMHPFYRPRSHPDGWSVNVRCMDDPWPTRFTATPFDGRHWERNVDAIR